MLEELSRRGFATIVEPGRRIVREELACEGEALPWKNPMAFARRALQVAKSDFERALSLDGPVFFDRSAIDAAAYIFLLDPSTRLNDLLGSMRYGKSVFMTPPWPELFQQDEERGHDMQQARGEYDRLVTVYPVLGYDLILLPKLSVEERADFLLDQLSV